MLRNRNVLIQRNIVYNVGRKLIEVINKRNQSQNPKNGYTRIKFNEEGNRYIETFQNGSWRFTRNF
ncbi:MAG TPA: hypothetical protein VFM31_10540 [Nitrososphaeraceae archaeon]|nr:hypothetical protein [Nitrososphaeraceae archaeon]